MSNIAEAFVFTYLGFTFFNSIKKRFSLSFIFYETIFVLLGRFISIYGVSYLMTEIFKLNNFKIKKSDQGIMFVSGSIRGSISFGLAVSIDTPNRSILISGTLVLVFFTTLCLGALMPKSFNYFKGKDEEGQLNIPSDTRTRQSFNFLSPNAQEYILF